MKILDLNPETKLNFLMSKEMIKSNIWIPRIESPKGRLELWNLLINGRTKNFINTKLGIYLWFYQEMMMIANKRERNKDL